ncbi:MutS protein 1 [Ceratocystis pirilliformis]|uniref:MutS protein 1 n=1 Tax=Ceratocystis pirilliformis TaxID=259994 RepID=A0ABR3ZGX2_9PEZI
MAANSWRSGLRWRNFEVKQHLPFGIQQNSLGSNLFRLTPVSTSRLFTPNSLREKSTQARPLTRKRTKAAEKLTIKLSDLPQGRLESSPENNPDEQLASEKNESLNSGMEDNASFNTDAKTNVDTNADAKAAKYPAVITQAHSNMQRFPNCVVLTRVGSFYELYLHQAEEFGPSLGLKISQKKTVAGPVSMSGFPFFQLERYLKILVQDLNRHVAIVDEFPKTEIERAKSGGLMHDRKVTRIVTPGTLIDETFMDPYTSNYAMAIHVDLPSEEPPSTREDQSSILAVATTTQLGLAWMDLSTGQFHTQLTDLASLPSILSRTSPREIVLDKALALSDSSIPPPPVTDYLSESRFFKLARALHSVLIEERHIISYSNPGHLSTLKSWEPVLEGPISRDLAVQFSDFEIKAGSLLLGYVEDRLQGSSIKLQTPKRHKNLNIMTIDKNSLRSLEIKKTMRDGAHRGSLLHATRKTVTRSGARLLADWLTSPSTDIVKIEERLDLVSLFHANPDLRDTVIVLLKRSHDSQRLVQKFALGRGNPNDLLGLAATIQATQEISQLLINAGNKDSTIDTSCTSSLLDRFSLDGPAKLAKQIYNTIDEEGLVHQHEIEESAASHMVALAEETTNSEDTQTDSMAMPKPTVKISKKIGNKAPTMRDVYGEDNEIWVMKPSASRALKKLHATLESLKEEKEQLCTTLRERYSASSLTLKWVPGLGHICHLKGKDIQNASVLSQNMPSQAHVLRASRTTRTFYLPEWFSLGARIDQARLSIRAEEQRVFASLREKVISNLIKIRRNSEVLDELDITTSFAVVAENKNFIRPQLTTSTITDIRGGRHPTVEGGLHDHGRSFTRNDCYLGGPSRGTLWLITGPNMAGKSTFLRQNALLTILAQVGCFVPAESAKLGIVDAIFSRIGSADNLYHDQSTFMVEMLETAQILRNATPRSFVIMDEIGRGTTPSDGTAVAYASLKHLVTLNKCRALFATHFHGVADLARKDKLLCDENDGTTGAIEAFCTDVEEDKDGGFVYVHKLRPGVNRQSHALKVAKLAGMPEVAIDTAESVLAEKGIVTQLRTHGSGDDN